jgi:hypothetical protein
MSRPVLLGVQNSSRALSNPVRLLHGNRMAVRCCSENAPRPVRTLKHVWGRSTVRAAKPGGTPAVSPRRAWARCPNGVLAGMLRPYGRLAGSPRAGRARWSTWQGHGTRCLSTDGGEAPTSVGPADRVTEYAPRPDRDHRNWQGRSMPEVSCPNRSAMGMLRRYGRQAGIPRAGPCPGFDHGEGLTVASLADPAPASRSGRERERNSGCGRGDACVAPE